MTDSDKKEFVTLMYTLASLYDLNMESKAILKIWFEALSDYAIEDVARGVTAYIKSPDYGSYKPKPADIIKMIDGTANERSFLAWTMVVYAIQRIGTYESVAFDDPIIHRVIDDMGGWCEMGRKSESELPFVAKEFMTRYRAFSAKGIVPMHAGKLIGVTEAQNSANGFYTEKPPVLIGKKDMAQLVYQHKMIAHVTE